MAPTIEIGNTIPDGTFTYVPYVPELDNNAACGVPTALNISKEWKGKKVILFGVPGAFTPTCHVKHLPPYISKYDELKAKGVDVIAVVAANDAFVMSAWGRIQGLKDKILTLSDPDLKWAKQVGLDADLSARGLGVRTARFALILDDLVVKYLGVETAPGIVDVSGVNIVVSNL